MSRNKKIPFSELALFCHETAIILKSGIPVSDGIRIISEEGTYKNLYKAINMLSESISEGKSFSDSITACGVFSDYFTSLVKLGEVSGNLDIIMEYLAEFYEKADKYNNKIRNAATYPIILSGLMACVILFLIIKVLPMFNDVLSSLGGDIPLAAKLVISTGKAVAAALPFAGLFLLIGAVAYLLYSQTEKGKYKLDELKLKTPYVGKIYSRLISARIGFGMSIMLKSGIDTEKAVTLASGITDNRFAALRIERVKQELAEGKELTEAFKDTHIFPALFIKMLQLGTKTGNTVEVLKRASEIYDNEVDNMLSGITSYIEPVLVIFLSAVIGIILITVMIPLIGIMSSIGL